MRSVMTDRMTSGISRESQIFPVLRKSGDGSDNCQKKYFLNPFTASKQSWQGTLLQKSAILSEPKFWPDFLNAMLNAHKIRLFYPSTLCLSLRVAMVIF